MPSQFGERNSKWDHGKGLADVQYTMYKEKPRKIKSFSSCILVSYLYSPIPTNGVIISLRKHSDTSHHIRHSNSFHAEHSGSSEPEDEVWSFNPVMLLCNSSKIETATSGRYCTSWAPQLSLTYSYHIQNVTEHIWFCISILCIYGFSVISCCDYSKQADRQKCILSSVLAFSCLFHVQAEVSTVTKDSNTMRKIPEGVIFCRFPLKKEVRMWTETDVFTSA